MGRIRRFRRCLYVPLLGAALAACSASLDADAMLSSGRKYLEAGDSRAAIIQFKNVLQQRPDSPEVRYLLGRTLLDSGEPAAGGVELRKALALSHPAAQVEPLIARGLLMEGQPHAVVERYAKLDLGDAGANAELGLQVARAHLALGRPDEARAMLGAVLSQVPGHAEATLLQARVLAARRELDAAFAKVEELLAREPGWAEAWLLKGELLQGRNDAPAAVGAYRKALALKKDLLDAHVALVSLALAGNEPEAAAARLGEMRALFAGSPQLLYLEAQHALLRRDHAAALEKARKLLARAPEDPKVLHLAGLAEFHGGSLQQAETHLGKVLQLDPGSVLARRLLAELHLRGGQSDKALALLQPAIDQGSADAALLALAGEALLLRGDARQAEAMYARVARLDPTDARTRTALALTRMARGEVEAATRELERIAASDDGTTGDLALIRAHLRQQRPEAALKALERLEAKAAGQPLVPYLQGMALAQMGRHAEARAGFERALEIQAAYLPAAAGLARLDLMDGQPQQAQQRFERVLAADRRNLQASMAIVELRRRAGASAQDMEALLVETVRRHPSEEPPRLALIEQRLRQQDGSQALVAAREAAAALPASVPVQEALGRALIAVGDHQQAVSVFGRLAAQQPASARAQLRLAQAQAAAQDPSAAQASLRRALELEPGSREAQRRLAALYAGSGRPQEGLALARTMQAQPGTEAAGFELEGDLEAAARRWSAAAAAYRSGLKKSDNGMMAAKLHLALSRAGLPAEAQTLAGQWLRSHPEDAIFRLHLGSLAMAQRDHAQAEDHFRQVLQSQPDHVQALDQVAKALARQGKPGATAFAEKANRLQPGQPLLMGTLAECLAQDRQWTQAIEVQKKAVGIAPRNPALRLGLARLYLSSGQKERARDELDRLRAQGRAFDGQAEVEELLRSL